MKPVAVSDYKITDYEKAKSESFLKNPIIHGVAVSSPTQTLSLSSCVNPQNQVACVFLKDGYVYKMFNANVDFFNLDLVKSL